MAVPVFAPWEDPTLKPLIQFKGVTKRFGDFTAIDNQTLDIYTREFFALLGPSGCGKTTMMRMLAGFEQPTEGQILIGGIDMKGVPPNEREVNMMFQSYALFPHLSVWENIAFGLRRMGQPKDELEARVEEMLRLTRLTKFARRKPHQISGGQRQRVALARSLARAPKLLLLDEPLGALDKKLREETQFELMDIQEKTGTTFVIVTHDQEEALIMSDRIAVMFDGQIAQLDSPEALYRKPNTQRVASFIGVMNFLDAKAVGEKGGKITLDIQALGTLDIPASALPEGMRPSEISRVGVRPEMMSVVMDGAKGSGHEIAAEIAESEYYGDMTYYLVSLPGKDEPVTISMRNTAGRAVLEPGSKTRVSFSPESIVVFR